MIIEMNTTVGVDIEWDFDAKTETLSVKSSLPQAETEAVLGMIIPDWALEALCLNS